MEDRSIEPEWRRRTEAEGSFSPLPVSRRIPALAARTKRWTQSGFIEPPSVQLPQRSRCVCLPECADSNNRICVSGGLRFVSKASVMFTCLRFTSGLELN